MDEKSRVILWKKYSKEKSFDIKEKLIIEYAQLVKVVAGRLNMYLGNNVEYEDLVGYGVFGLIDAIDKFNFEKGVKFETYASLRIRGAILDNIRRMDWIPRSLRKKQKLIDNANSKLENALERLATDEEIACELDITLKEYKKWLNQTKLLTLTSLEEYIEQGSEIRIEPMNKSRYTQPERVVEKNELKEILAEVIDNLLENEKRVIVLYYFEELTLKEISQILEVSESRVSQIHTKALKKLKIKLGNNMELLAGF
ncbi:FliA/WhiG family RNA polymerase sigma factor [Vallitalea sp.]|jgi:RNA polymerase sigma factor for flagellar operon FliA|uniref:FliA/WhiG family RNA polymerase sigma factor n=1 Tax=Vallitalea sp. TaxID=1882829 RepID=UPI0025EDE1DC|nr:FliA/WhiG family RNA polymerase sigma factor [Vallitalea sp.]MCT4688253.1 FliA/WhiG family RNA polymerase sigma factor [Vallitalea sp.]